MADNNTDNQNLDLLFLSVNNNETLFVENHYKILVEKLQQQTKDNDAFCDVVLIVEGKRFPAHRCLLSAFSDYFRTMFTIDMEEKRSREITLHDISAEAMKIIINSLYSGKISLSEQTIVDVLYAASLMQVNVVLKAAKSYMSDTINLKNCWFFRDLAKRYSFDDICNQVNNSILQEFDDGSLQTDLLQLKFEEINGFLASNELTVDEEKFVFEFILKWVEKDIANRKRYFSTLFKHVRLQFNSLKYVADVIEKNCFVREFHECRNLVGNAISFHLTPKFADAQKPRKYFGGKPDSVILFSSRMTVLECHLYDPLSNKTNKVTFKLKNNKLVLPSCTVAENFPIIAFCGGVDANQRTSNHAIQFDGFRWLSMPSMNESRCGAAAVFYNENLYVFGGEKVPVSPNDTYPTNIINSKASSFAENYELFSSHLWQVSPFPIKSLSYFVAVVLNKTIYLIGGYCLTTEEYCNDNIRLNKVPCKLVSNTNLKFFPAENKWEHGTKMTEARARFGAAVVGKNIIVAGGYGKNNAALNSMECFDTVFDSWSIIKCSLPHDRHGLRFSLISRLVCIKGVLYIHKDGCFYMLDKDTQSWKELSSSYVSEDLMIPYAKQFHLSPIIEANLL